MKSLKGLVMEGSSVLEKKKMTSTCILFSSIKCCYMPLPPGGLVFLTISSTFFDDLLEIEEFLRYVARNN